MQYRLNLLSHKKSKANNDMINSGGEIISLLSVLLGGALISRVVVFLNTKSVDGIAPFGVAYLIAIAMTKNKKKIVAASIGTIIGYLTIIEKLQNDYVNVATVSILLLYSLISIKVNKRVKELISFILVMVTYFVYGYFVSHLLLKVNITQAVINTTIIIPLYYILRYGAECIREFNENYMFSAEEIISMGILICLLVCGFGDIKIADISLRNILAYSIILIFSYAGGGAYGTTIGVVMGLIVGMCSGDVMHNIGYYSLIGLVSGIFKDVGKIVTSLTFMLTYTSIIIYNHDISKVSIIEVLIGVLIFYIIPKKLFNIIEIEINMDKKRIQINQVELSELKEEFTDKVKGLGAALVTVSNTLESIGSNKTLEDKCTGEAMVSNLADRVCSKCAKSKQCWDKEFNITYNSFTELIDNSEMHKDQFPNQLEKVCLEKNNLIRNADSLVNKLKSSRIKKESLEEGRLLLAKHIKNMAISIDNMLSDFKRDVVLCGDIERVVRKSFNRSSIKYKSIFCYRDTSGRARIKVTLDRSVQEKIEDKELLAIINKVMSTQMSICEEKSNLDINNGEYTIVFEETPRFQVVSYGAISPKEGEEFMGDTYSFGKTKEGNYMTVVSDGMGTGAEASKESGITVEIIERFFEAGFDNNTAINMVNSIMGIKFEEDEKISTLDLNVIDLYSGEIDFMKVGAVPSYIKRGKNVKSISSNMPPFGLTDELEMEPIKSNVKSGDIVITVSDGILDANSEDNNWLQKYLINSTREPKQLAQDILQKAKELNGGKSKDDMTVVVSKVSNFN